MRRDTFYDVSQRAGDSGFASLVKRGVPSGGWGGRTTLARTSQFTYIRL